MQTRPRPTAAALAIAVVTRVALAGIVWMSLRIFPRFAPYQVQLPDSFLPDHPALDGWARWDAAHYVAIARQGYGGDNPSPHGGAGFFPLYPLLMRGLVEALRLSATPAHLALAGIAISVVCFLGSAALLARLGVDQVGEGAAANAVLLLCTMPFGVFFTAAYSESLFFVLSLLAIVLAGRGRWRAAGIAAGLGSATRLVGLALAPSLILLAIRRGARARDTVATGLLAVSGTVAYVAYCAWKFDDPFAYFHAQATWGGWNEHVRFYAELFMRHPRAALGGDPRHLIIVLNVGMAIAFLAFVPRLWRALDPGLALFTTLLVIVQAAFTWVSLGRYLLPAAGVYLVAGAWLAQPRWSGRVRDAVIVVSALLLSLLAVLYGHAFWVV